MALPNLRVLVLLSGAILPMACARPAQRAARVQQVLEDARGDGEAFRRHFSAGVSAQAIASWQASLAKEGPAQFEEKEGPLCVRAYWGDTVIDHSQYFHFERAPTTA